MAVVDLYKKACDAVERANYDYAVELFREVLRQDPEYPEARIALRGTERRRVQERGSSVVPLLTLPFRLALTAVTGAFSKPKKRLEVYEDLLAQSPDSFLGLMGAGAAARKAGYLGEAVTMLKDAQRLKPSNKRVLRALTNVLVEMGDPPQALPYLERLLAQSPNNRDLQKEVRDLDASGHMSTHKMAEADSFRDLIRDKEVAEELEQEGRMTVTRSDVSARMAEAEDEVRHAPRNVNRILGLVQLYLRDGQLAKARKLLLLKHEEMPDNYEVREKLGDVQMSVYDMAIENTRTALEQSPDDAGARRKLESLCGKRSRFAIMEYRWRLAEHPSDRAAHMDLGKAHLAIGRYNEAIGLFQEAIHDPRFGVQAVRMLGLSFYGKKQYDLAVEQFQRAIERHPAMDPEGKELRYNLAQAYESMGDKGNALLTYKKVYSQDINFMDVADKVDQLMRQG